MRIVTCAAMAVMMGVSLTGYGQASSDALEANLTQPSGLKMRSFSDVLAAISPPEKPVASLTLTFSYSVRSPFDVAKKKKQEEKAKLTSDLQSQISLRGWGDVMLSFVKAHSKTELTAEEENSLVQTISAYSQTRQNEIIKSIPKIIRTHGYFARFRPEAAISFLNIALLSKADLKNLNKMCRLDFNTRILQEEKVKSEKNHAAWVEQRTKEIAAIAAAKITAGEVSEPLAKEESISTNVPVSYGGMVEEMRQVEQKNSLLQESLSSSDRIRKLNAEIYRLEAEQFTDPTKDHLEEIVKLGQELTQLEQANSQAASKGKEEANQ